MSTYLVIFGAAVRADGTPSGSLARRVSGALDYSRGRSSRIRSPFKFLATGGVGRHGPAEAFVIRDLLLRQGVSLDDVLIEDRARDTLESILLCNDLLARRDDVELVVPCTSRYHVPRCALLFRLAGYPVASPRMPSDAPHLVRWKRIFYVLKEFVALPYDALLLTWHLARKRASRRLPIKSEQD